LPMDEAGYTRLLRQEVNRLYQTVELKPGVREMLARLAQQGARMCICSNTWEAQCREVLCRLGVESYFEFFITAQGEQ
ncbi:HAD hydrolase-like protein, partial [Acinetobacter baumannii]|nr:HAD hydrolase-like protein [Acinetobacter baumannii]